MSDIDPINRRELLRRTAILFGGALSAPAVLGVMHGRRAHAAEGWKPSFLSQSQLAVVAAIADIMIPRTDTPGASDVGVPAFIDDMLANVYPAADQHRYLTGLTEFEDLAQSRHGRALLALDPEPRRNLVQAVHDAALDATASESDDAEQRPFILMTKELTLLGFFTSREGMTMVLQYDPQPGAYHGCLPLDATGNGRTWASEVNLPF